MNLGNGKTDDDDNNVGELRQLLRRLETDLGPPITFADGVEPSIPQDTRRAGLPVPSRQSAPPPLRLSSVPTTLRPGSGSWAVGPRFAAAGAVAIIAALGLIFGAGNSPWSGASTLPSPAKGDAKGSKDALQGFIATAPAVQAAEKPAPEVRAMPSFASPSVASARLPAPPSAPASSPTPRSPEPALTATADPAPKPPEPVAVERRTAAVEPPPPEKPAAPPSPPKSASSPAPVLTIPPSFMIEAGVTSPFPVRLARDAVPRDGGYLIVTGLLRGSRFSSGTEILFDTWQIPISALGDLQLTTPSDGETELAIELRSAQGQTVARTTAILQAVVPAKAALRQ